MAIDASRYADLENALRHPSVTPSPLPLDFLKMVTNSFSPDRELGRGAFGVVYKGVFSNGHVIAVKKLLETTGVQDLMYQNEIFNLMRLKHQNIVQFLGYCDHIQRTVVVYEGKYVLAEVPERLLCFEYMDKGSLDELLSDESCGLDWHQRYKIIDGICRGLHYLHEEWQMNTPIIHLDLKPANILLDSNMMPKISDFGLSRLFGLGQTRTRTQNSPGSIGYMAPEYMTHGTITIQSDMFSLGVIIIQIITGQKNYPYGTSANNEYIEKVCTNWRNKLEEQVDCQQVKEWIEIGLNCVEQDPNKRPTTRDIIQRLDRRNIMVGKLYQKEAPPDMQCKDKFLVQSTRVNEDHMPEDISNDMFAKETGKVVDEMKLGAVYVPLPKQPSLSHEGPDENSTLAPSLVPGMDNLIYEEEASNEPQLRAHKEPGDEHSEGSCVLNDLLEIDPLELCFPFELKKQISCELQLRNNSNDCVAFKFRVTNPKKYRVRPNKHIVTPHSACLVIITMQAQKEAPPDMQCKDKFLVQSTRVNKGFSPNYINNDMFAKEPGKVVDEVKLGVVYVPLPQGPQPPSPSHEEPEEDSTLAPSLVPGMDNLIYEEEASNEPQLRAHKEPGDEQSEGSCVLNDLLEIDPLELCFPFEVKKQISCELQLLNNSNDCVAFNIRATNPKKYRVRPNRHIVTPHSACLVIITRQAQKEAPPDMQCKDKFLVQSTRVNKDLMPEDISNDMFAKETGKVVDEVKLGVVYVPVPQGPQPPSPSHEEPEEDWTPTESSNNQTRETIWQS